MRRAFSALNLVVIIASLSACASGAHDATMQSPAGSLVPQQTHAIPISTAPPVTNACAHSVAANAECDVKERDDVTPVLDSGDLDASKIPGYHPADIQRAYALPRTSGGTIAVVVPYRDPAAESDLAVYRAKFGLPSCTTVNGCLRFVAQDGSARLPRSSKKWSIETSVDLDVASAACPECPLLVVEASSDGLMDLRAALMQAVAQRPAVVSNSWIVPENAVSSAVPLAHDGVAIVAGTGDRATGISWPAVDPTVIAVGGTTLLPADSERGFAESAWSSAGFGCSTIFSKPAWQSTQCSTRAVADVSALADPVTGVAIYDSVPLVHGPHKGKGGWEVCGGTSVATPIVAAAIALANNGQQLSTPQYIYERAGSLNRIAGGTSPLQAGLGSPNGIGAF